jgi:hypothetical protein
MTSKKQKSNKSEVDIAFTIYEKVFVDLKNWKSRESNKHHVGHPDRIEHDISEVHKSHLDLLSKKVDVEIFKETQNNNIKLSNRIYYLNWFIALLTIVIAGAAFYEVVSKIFINQV